ncbi:1,4-alpha-glucan branching protein GlgB [Clostridium sp. YIM B02505]|uniref:1,4-alpha-glucan branching enzyme GlgB n=1 Tax=Clostridium yunnanense TaxID=2800325 RepID=A0ABS1ETB9_9CLOT|nr:1,4-alpha-glucan branching protein GlgB [Clostridium yunnanense]MBK1812625.1 1,4-alpha-glucan branching protein GlgB [Clostridium yunnanense]
MSNLENDLDIVVVEETAGTKELAQKKNVTKKKTTRAKKSNTEEVNDNVDKATVKKDDKAKVTTKTSKTRKTTKKANEALEGAVQELEAEGEELVKKTTRRTTKKKDAVDENKAEVKPKKTRTRTKKVVDEPISLEIEELNIERVKEDKQVLKAHKNEGVGIVSDLNIYLFHEGNNYESYKFMGCHLVEENGISGARFTTWAPNASAVHVVGNFSSWESNDDNKLKRISESGLWSGFIPELKAGAVYKYAITSKDGKKIVLKSDPYAFASELRPNTASLVTGGTDYTWKDDKWLEKRNNTNVYESPINIYELHLGSWSRKEDGSFYNYLELAEILPSYVEEMGYTHVELMPIMEHPLDDSWGYQVTGYYSVTRRYGSSDDFKVLVDSLHEKNIGVILDWVPGHFCKDEHGLYMFDGTPTYEYSEVSKQENKGWGAANFDLGKPEVKSFLISNALYWLKNFHIDGLRVDAVANMIYLDYDRKHGEWKPNKYGGRENLEAVEFLKALNKAIFKQVSNILVVAEESTSWPMVTKPVDIGGLGFNFKWNMGWMNDMLRYIQIDPIYRKHHHNLITFSMMYNYSENFILPISHDEVVHGKKSLVDKMWGDYWNKFAGLRLFISYMLAHPGKKLLFMGSEFAQFIEWRNHEGLEFKLLEKFEMHRDTQKFFKDINKFYLENEALWQYDYNKNGFEWIDADNATQSIIVFARKTDDPKKSLIYVCNFTSIVYYDFNIGVPYLGEYQEVFNTDSKEYGGSGQLIGENLFSDKSPWHNQKYKLTIKVPPMATLILKPVNIIDDVEENEQNILEGLDFDKALSIAEKQIKDKE